MDLQWQRFESLTYSNSSSRSASVLLPTKLSSEWLRIEIIVLAEPRPRWYKAGWINQVLSVQGLPYLRGSEIVPLAPSIFKFENQSTYQVRFQPVFYLPNCIVKFYRSLP